MRVLACPKSIATLPCVPILVASPFRTPVSNLGVRGIFSGLGCTLDRQHLIGNCLTAAADNLFYQCRTFDQSSHITAITLTPAQIGTDHTQGADRSMMAASKAIATRASDAARVCSNDNVGNCTAYSPFDTPAERGQSYAIYHAACPCPYAVSRDCVRGCMQRRISATLAPDLDWL